MKNIVILNGPNLNLMGIRQTDIYGEMSLAELNVKLIRHFQNVKFTFFQSNHEGDLIDKLHYHGFECDGIVLNAGAYTHTSIAIADAVRSITVPVVEVHISDIEKREDFRKHSYLKDACISTRSGEGVQAYFNAVEELINN